MCSKSAVRACTHDETGMCALVQDIKFNVHAHPTLAEVLDELFKGAHVERAAPAKVAHLLPWLPSSSRPLHARSC